MKEKFCKDCIFWGWAIFVCFKEENEGIRAFENTPACKYFKSKKNETN
jgi:hypothetical protein